MSSETTDDYGIPPARGWVGFDGDCGICRGGVRRWHAVFERRGFLFVPLRNPWLRHRLNLTGDGIPEEMKLLQADGQVKGGVDAIAALCQAVWWLLPFGGLLRAPGIHALANSLYRWLARRRHRPGQCPIQTKESAPAHSRHKAFLELP